MDTMGRNRKMKNQSVTQHPISTIVVRNLPLSFTIHQLEETFTEIGPIRRRGLVTEKGSLNPRGMGFVQFAAVEDANRAVELKNDSHVAGRRICVMHLPTLKQRRSKQNKEA